MHSANPAYIPRNHLIEEVIVAAVDQGDLSPFQQLIEVLDSPYVEQPGQQRYAAPPRPEEPKTLPSSIVTIAKCIFRSPEK